MKILIGAVALFITFLFGAAVGFLFAIRGGYFGFKTREAWENRVTFAQWKAEHLRRFT